MLMGLAGSVHCFAMCGASSAAAVHSCGSGGPIWRAFHAGRVIGYAVAGALVATSMGWLARLAQWSPALKPLWVLVHILALALGMWLLWKGRQPEFLERMGRQSFDQGLASRSATAPIKWVRRRGTMKSLLIGAAWVAWPCGLLQSALVVAALANSAASGAAVMAGFALSSAVALSLGPALLLKLMGARPSQGVQQLIVASLVRVSGAALVMASAWALGHDLWMRVAAYCFS